MMSANNEIRKALWDACSAYVQERIATARQAIASARDAANDDTKSSAGDKFETTREMMQQDIRRHEQLLTEALRMEQVLKGIDVSSADQAVRPGSLAETSRGNFYIAVSAGHLRHNGKDYYAVSTASPIGALLLGTEPGSRFTFNNLEYQVITVG